MKILVPRYRFGVFDFDPENGVLSREGVPVKLQAQPAQVLAMLLAEAGHVVSRDALHRAVWGTDTFVDFDRGLNFCIAQIRSALRDSAESPRYIRTSPRKGYQFIAPVVSVDLAPATSAPKPSSAAPPAKQRRRLLVPVAMAVLLLLGAAVAWRARQPGALATTVAVFRLDNATGDGRNDRLADILTDSLIAELTESGAKSGEAGYSVIGNDIELRRPRAQRDLLAIGSRLRTPVTVSGSIRPVAAGTAGQLEVFVQVITLPDQQHRKVVRVPLPATALAEPSSDVPRRIVEAIEPAIRAPHTPP